MNTNKSRAQNEASGWLQTFIVTGSLAATVAGAGMIARMESFKADAALDDSAALEAEPLVLEPIPTIMQPATTNSVAILPTPTPTNQQQSAAAAVIPTDKAEPTYTPAPTATPVLRQQSQSTQQIPTTTVRRRSRSSR